MNYELFWQTPIKHRRNFKNSFNGLVKGILTGNLFHGKIMENPWFPLIPLDFPFTQSIDSYDPETFPSQDRQTATVETVKRSRPGGPVVLFDRKRSA